MSEPRPKGERLRVPPHWKVPPDYGKGTRVSTLRVEEDFGYLHQAWRKNSYGENEFFFNDNGDLLSYRINYQHIPNLEKGVSEFIEIGLMGDTPRYARIAKHVQDDGPSYQNVWLPLGDFFFIKDNWGLFRDLARVDCNTLGRVDIGFDYTFIGIPRTPLNEEEEKNQDYYINRVFGPYIWFIPQLSSLGEIEGFNLNPKFDHNKFPFTFGLAPPGSEDQYIVEENGKLAYRIRSRISERGLATFEQEYAYEDRPGQGTTKIVRFDLHKFNLPEVLDMAYADTFDPQTGELTAPWRFTAEPLGDPMVTFRGPLRELLASLSSEEPNGEVP